MDKKVQRMDIQIKIKGCKKEERSEKKLKPTK